MFHTFFNALFGCTHQRTTFPLTPGRKAAATSAARLGTYVVCLDCGQEFPYDWDKMKRLKVLTERRAFSSGPVTVLQDDEAV